MFCHVELICGHFRAFIVSTTSAVAATGDIANATAPAESKVLIELSFIVLLLIAFYCADWRRFYLVISSLLFGWHFWSVSYFRIDRPVLMSKK